MERDQLCTKAVPPFDLCGLFLHSLLGLLRLQPIRNSSVILVLGDEVEFERFVFGTIFFWHPHFLSNVAIFLKCFSQKLFAAFNQLPKALR